MVQETAKTQNPIIAHREEYPCLEWRRAQGRECSSCYNVIKKFFWHLRKEQLEEDLNNNPDARNRFNEHVADWESERNAGNQRSWNQDKRRGDTTVSVEQGDSVITEQHLGWLWPLDVYKRETGKDALRKQITTVTHQGRPVRGVVMAEKDC